MEVGTNGRLSFLDTMILLKIKELYLIDIKKQFFPINFLVFSSHLLCHKKNIIFCIVDRIVRLPHSRFHKKNLTNAIYIYIFKQ